MYKKESLEKLLILINQICQEQENTWFKKSLEFKFSSSFKSNYNDEVYVNTEKIKNYLSLSPELSIDYSFISHKILRTRLELDNLRMENMRLNLLEKDEFKRFFDYIIFAFFQVENLINYYYFLAFPDINTFLDHLESIEKTKFKRNKYFDYDNVGDITIATKLYSFNKTFFNQRNNFTGFNIDNLRQVRNEGLHRCSVLYQKPLEEYNRIQKFLQKSSYESILNDLSTLTNVVNKQIQKIKI